MRLLADQVGVSIRTVYRWLAEPEEDYLIDVDGWSAVFAVSPGHQPRRISPWQRRA